MSITRFFNQAGEKTTKPEKTKRGAEIGRRRGCPPSRTHPAASRPPIPQGQAPRPLRVLTPRMERLRRCTSWNQAQAPGEANFVRLRCAMPKGATAPLDSPTVQAAAWPPSAHRSKIGASWKAEKFYSKGRRSADAARESAPQVSRSHRGTRVEATGTTSRPWPGLHP